MLRWLKKRRMRAIVGAATLSAPVVLWLLFPPLLHRQLKAVRSMQSDEESHMREFLAQVQANPIAADVLVEQLQAPDAAQRHGPLAEMPLRFDVNRYFEAFDRLAMDDGYTLDYVYCCTATHAYPLLYARLTEDAPLDDVAAFENAFGDATDPRSVAGAYLNRLRTDASRQGFIQLAALYLIGDQFYLYWHARYNDIRILSRIPARVTYSTDEVAVSLIVFSKWGGVARYVITMNRAFPHEVVQERFTTILPYFSRRTY